MLCKNPATLAKVCNNLPAGVSKMWLFDPMDFTWTQASPVNGTGVLSVVARATGATAIGGALMYPIGLDHKENAAEYTYKQSSKNRKPKYEHQVELKYEELSQTLTDWNSAIDATACCGVGVVLLLNSGKIIVLGEKVIGGVEKAYALELIQDGSSGTSGKASDDFAGQTIILKGDHNLPANTFSGNISVIIGFES